MKKTFYKISAILIFTIFLFFSGCKNDLTPSLYDIPASDGGTPVISAINPDSALAGVSEITINGSNFSPNPADNFVYFNGRLGKVIQASKTQLIVVSPGLPDESMVSEQTQLKISVLGSALLSETKNYKLLAAVSKLYSFPPNNIPLTIASDKEGYIYTSLTVSGVGGGIAKISANGDYMPYAPRGIETNWNGLRFSPDDTLFAAKLLSGVWKIVEGQVPENRPWVILTGNKIADMDFDAAKNMWAIGNNKNIYKITPDKIVTGFPFEPNLKTIKILNSAIFAGGVQNSKEIIWKFEIAGDGTIGSGEEYFNFSANFSGYKINAITLSEDGDLFIATDAKEQIIVVHPNKNFEPLYPGLLKSSAALSFAWDNSTNLYYSRAEGVDSTNTAITPTIVRLNVQKKGAK